MIIVQLFYTVCISCWSDKKKIKNNSILFLLPSTNAADMSYIARISTAHSGQNFGLLDFGLTKGGIERVLAEPSGRGDDIPGKTTGTAAETL